VLDSGSAHAIRDLADEGSRRITHTKQRRAVLLLSCIAGCAKKQEKKPPAPSVKVDVATVDRGDIKYSLRVSGPLKFIANTIVSSEVAAQVKSIEVSE
ncbi:MAG: hypothetical protein FJY85_19095, partial [Deltaproteobacteria bacterium]|nr:hypothetical protein [Deltaproteobacteria bacterium]